MSTSPKKFPYQPYTTPKTAPQAIHFWDNAYRQTTFWYDWLVLKSTAEFLRQDIQDCLGCTIEEADNAIWHDYIDATEGKTASPMFEVYRNFCMTLTIDTFPLYCVYLSIGCDIHDGLSEREAIEKYKDWLLKDPKNPIYGDYRVHSDLTIHKI